jgi:hypothetical protein
MTSRYPVGVAATTQDGSVAITAVGNSGNQAALASHTHTIPFNVGTDVASGAGEVWMIGDAIDTTPSPVIASFESWIMTGSINSLTGPVRAANSVKNMSTNGFSGATQNIQPDSIQVIFIIKVI